MEVRFMKIVRAKLFVFRKPHVLCLLTLAAFGFSASANAAGIYGVWASEASSCDKIFTRRGNQTSFATDSDSYGSGLIIEGKRITGKMGRCVIGNVKRERNTFHLFSLCASDISEEPLQVSLRLISENKITRIFPDIPEMETEYFRCPSK